jgi:hypothetical protein
MNMVGEDVVFRTQHAGTGTNAIDRQLLLCGDSGDTQEVKAKASPGRFRIESSQRTRLTCSACARLVDAGALMITVDARGADIDPSQGGGCVRGFLTNRAR